MVNIETVLELLYGIIADGAHPLPFTELDRQKNRWHESSSLPSVNDASHTASHSTGREQRSLALSRHSTNSQYPLSAADQRTSTQSLAVAARAAIEWLLHVRQVQRRQQQQGQKDTARVMIFQKKEEVFNHGVVSTCRLTQFLRLEA